MVDNRFVSKKRTKWLWVRDITWFVTVFIAMCWVVGGLIITILYMDGHNLIGGRQTTLIIAGVSFLISTGIAWRRQALGGTMLVVGCLIYLTYLAFQFTTENIIKERVIGVALATLPILVAGFLFVLCDRKLQTSA
ncbi:MAG: hypothetical protein GY803_05250 [Chloroflexi bacterium]|nr:hypothetical protein [Chloroflexota bacterium]